MRNHIIFTAFVLFFMPATFFALSKIYIKNEYQPVRITVFSSSTLCSKPINDELIPLTKTEAPYIKNVRCSKACITRVVIKTKDGEEIATFTVKQALCENAYIQLNKIGSIWWGSTTEDGTFLLPEEEPIIVSL